MMKMGMTTRIDLVKLELVSECGFNMRSSIELIRRYRVKIRKGGSLLQVCNRLVRAERLRLCLDPSRDFPKEYIE